MEDMKRLWKAFADKDTNEVPLEDLDMVMRSLDIVLKEVEMEEA